MDNAGTHSTYKSHPPLTQWCGGVRRCLLLQIAARRAFCLRPWSCGDGKSCSAPVAAVILISSLTCNAGAMALGLVAPPWGADISDILFRALGAVAFLCLVLQPAVSLPSLGSRQKCMWGAGLPLVPGLFVGTPPWGTVPSPCCSSWARDSPKHMVFPLPPRGRHRQP